MVDIHCVAMGKAVEMERPKSQNLIENLDDSEEKIRKQGLLRNTVQRPYRRRIRGELDAGPGSAAVA
jgi:hypothetical protein